MTDEEIRLTKRELAQMVADIREQGEDSVGGSVARQVAQINIVWSFYDSLLGQELDEPDLTQEEAEKILSELPTTYDKEEDLINTDT